MTWMISMATSKHNVEQNHLQGNYIVMAHWWNHLIK